MCSKGFGLGRMFNHLRKMRTCENLSDIAIFRLILNNMRTLGKLPSRNKIGHHFRKKISKDDWDGSPKGEILKDLNDPTP